MLTPSQLAAISLLHPRGRTKLTRTSPFDALLGPKQTRDYRIRPYRRQLEQPRDVYPSARVPHIIAGSNKVFLLIASGAESWGAYFVHFFLPTLIGNIIGGVSLVAFLGYAQVVAGKES